MKKRYKVDIPDVFFDLYLPQYANMSELPRKAKKAAKKQAQIGIEKMLNDPDFIDRMKILIEQNV
jgi:hypothetical protein